MRVKILSGSTGQLEVFQEEVNAWMEANSQYDGLIQRIEHGVASNAVVVYIWYDETRLPRGTEL